MKCPKVTKEEEVESVKGAPITLTRCQQSFGTISRLSSHLEGDCVLLPTKPKQPVPTSRRAPRRSRAVQTERREIECQTDPWEPPFKNLPKCKPGDEPELLRLGWLTWGKGLPAGEREARLIIRARKRRAWERMLPPPDSACNIRKREAIIRALEADELAYRDADLQERYDGLLREAIRRLRCWEAKKAGKARARLDLLEAKLQERGQRCMDKLRTRASRELRKLRENHRRGSIGTCRKSCGVAGGGGGPLPARRSRHRPCTAKLALPPTRMMQPDGRGDAVLTTTKIPRWLLDMVQGKSPARHGGSAAAAAAAEAIKQGLCSRWMKRLRSVCGKEQLEDATSGAPEHDLLRPAVCSGGGDGPCGLQASSAESLDELERAKRLLRALEQRPPVDGDLETPSDGGDTGEGEEDWDADFDERRLRSDEESEDENAPTTIRSERSLIASEVMAAVEARCIADKLQELNRELAEREAGLREHEEAVQEERRRAEERLVAGICEIVECERRKAERERKLQEMRDAYRPPCPEPEPKEDPNAEDALFLEGDADEELEDTVARLVYRLVIPKADRIIDQEADRKLRLTAAYGAVHDLIYGLTHPPDCDNLSSSSNFDPDDDKSTSENKWTQCESTDDENNIERLGDAIQLILDSVPSDNDSSKDAIHEVLMELLEEAQQEARTDERTGAE
ncbi:uncharacterized protein LOC106659711 [Trichogramma pretiosum]|uniref:uncharacterized protein LOC106659711 n=1 Tax=Trichogramma pretiosum TaxID=7493 RepID=UPI0006C9B283|nr:uncharacterized protein LOC106659711 [Trichogramma pretiosum]